MTDESSSRPMAQEGRPRAGRKQIGLSLLRVAGAVAALLLAFFMFPISANDNLALGLAAVVVGLIGFGLIFSRQLPRIRRAEFPLLRAAEAIVLVATLFVLIMATFATVFSTADHSAYSENLSRLDALYFTVTTLATVGYGDITPTSDLTRAFTTLQILLGVALLGAGLRSLATVAQRAADDRDRAAD